MSDTDLQPAINLLLSRAEWLRGEIAADALHPTSVTVTAARGRVAEEASCCAAVAVLLAERLTET